MARGGLVTALVAPVPLVVLSGVVVYPLGFLLETAGSGYGTSLLAGYADWLQTAFAGPRLPTFVPRVGMILVSALAVLLLVAAAGAARAGWAATGTRRGVVVGAGRALRRRAGARGVHGRAVAADSRRRAGGAAVDVGARPPLRRGAASRAWGSPGFAS